MFPSLHICAVFLESDGILEVMESDGILEVMESDGILEVMECDVNKAITHTHA